TGALATEARELNIGFFSRMTRGRPWVRVKVAASLDGRTALPDGRSQWITGPPARADGHVWRRRAGAVLTGIGTVLADDPRLDVRSVPTELQPLRVVLDSKRRLPAGARLLAAPGRALQVTAVGNDASQPVIDCEVLVLPSADGQVDLAGLLMELARREINEVHVEGGARLNAALLSAGWVDELLVYLSPRVLGEGRGMASLDALGQIDDAPRFTFHEVRRVGDDLRLRLRPAPGPVGGLDTPTPTHLQGGSVSH
ncbi:MAG: bifunctional diaminohydroxyphosphoribosylaminopyrimidine deaminase/5-amino-6-(5-phosphoribosylamino)uracil reductase RibD, partial [Chitinophagaceae bacterium]|nr:bifunctional diaminohydroxyphosphoribosylaminopyrimidine deaminase/5-amino-6-(5-phosphoribosylamino)uracil reductase RibD [Rubrivivax sp.]